MMLVLEAVTQSLGIFQIKFAIINTACRTTAVIYQSGIGDRYQCIRS